MSSFVFSSVDIICRLIRRFPVKHVEIDVARHLGAGLRRALIHNSPQDEFPVNIPTYWHKLTRLIVEEMNLDDASRKGDIPFSKTYVVDKEDLTTVSFIFLFDIWNGDILTFHFTLISSHST